MVPEGTTRKVGRPRSCDCGECRKCYRRQYMKQWYDRKSLEERRAWIARRDVERVRAYDRKRYREKPNRRRPANYAAPEKLKARRAVAYAVRCGKIIKPDTCQRCSKPTPRHLLGGHHEDYSKPLEVVWLCRACHGLEHRRG